MLFIVFNCENINHICIIFIQRLFLISDNINLRFNYSRGYIIYITIYNLCTICRANVSSINVTLLYLMKGYHLIYALKLGILNIFTPTSSKLFINLYSDTGLSFIIIITLYTIITQALCTFSHHLRLFKNFFNDSSP